MFKARVLDIGSVHKIRVSYVDRDSMVFSVQDVSMDEIFQQLVGEINACPKSPLQEPPLPGSVCLGCHPGAKFFCRAVVMSVREQECKLYYVDYGDTEVLPYSNIFHLPSKYINPSPLAMRFTLSRLKDMVITPPMVDYFKEIVTGMILMLWVKPSEGYPMIQYGELYADQRNVRDILKKKYDVAPLDYEHPLVLRRGFEDVVHVTYVESCAKFFVRLDNNLEPLDEYAKHAPQLDKSCLKVGRPCWAQYTTDMHWYRAQILSVTGDQVAVLYVDYGNEEVVAASTLRKIPNFFVTYLRPQAIRCVLNGHQNFPLNQDFSDEFELLVLEKKVTMKVMGGRPKKLLVDLFDCEVAPRVSITSKLLSPNAPNPRAAIDRPNAHEQAE